MRQIETISADSLDYDEHVLKSRDDINRISVSTITDITEQAHQLVDIGDSKVAVGLLMPRATDVDVSRFLVMPAPFGNWLTESMVLRAMMIQANVGEGNHPMLVLPNNTYKNFAYTVEKDDLKLMAQKKLFDPVADQQAGAIESVKSGVTSEESKFTIVSYSQGSSIAPGLARHLPVDVLISADAPNTDDDRTPSQLRTEFIKSGSGLSIAVHDSRIIALNHFQRLKKNGKVQFIHQLSGAANVARDALLVPINRALHHAMSGGAHFEHLEDVQLNQPDMRLVIARAAMSGIFKAGDFIRAQGMFDADFYELAKYGHEAADNVTQFSAFTRAATTLELPEAA